MPSETADELHRGVVDEKVLELHVRVLFVVDAVDDLAPHAGGLQHVALVDARHLVLALARGLERLARDANDLVLVVLHHVVGALAATAVFARALLVIEALSAAEVDASRELADEHHVDAADDLRAQRGRAGQGVVDLDGAQVGVEAQPLADAQKPLLGARGVGVGGVPLGPAHAGEKHRVRGLSRREGLVGQRVAARVDGCAADEVVLEDELDVGLRAHGGQDLLALGDDLGKNKVKITIARR